MPSYTFPVVSPAAFIICFSFIFGDVLSPAISNCDFIFNMVIADSGMQEIGTRQLNNWRLHEPPDFLPFCQPGALSTRLHCSRMPRHHTRLPGRYTSPPVLSEDLSSEKTERAFVNTDLRGTDAEFQAIVLSAALTLHQTLHRSLDTWLHQWLSSSAVSAS